MELMIGRVIKSHGIRGEVVVEPSTDEPGIRYAVGEVLTGRQSRREHELTVAAVRPHQSRLLIKFEEIPDRTAADSLRGVRFYAAPLERDEHDDDGFYDHELEGLRVLHGERDNADIGVVTGVLHGPAGTLLEVELTDGGESLIPFVHEIVPEVDLAAGTCMITPPEGLLDL